MLLQQAVRWRDPDSDAPRTAEWEVRNLARLPFGAWSVLLVLGDLCVVLPCATLLLLRHFSAPQQEYGRIGMGVIGLALLWLLVSGTQALYERALLLGALRRQLVQGAISVVVLFGVILLLTSAFQCVEDAQLVGPAALSVTAFAGLVVLRLLWRHRLRWMLGGGRCLERSLMLAGSLDAGHAMGRYIERKTAGEVRFAAVTTLPEGPGGPPFDRIEEAIREGLIDRVFITDFEHAVSDWHAVVRRLRCLAVDVTIVPGLTDVKATLLRPNHIGAQAVMDVGLRPLSAMQAVIKRIEDLVLAGFFLVLALPLFLLIGIAIRLDTPGPLLFRQWRAGVHDRPFRVWKFRTMHHSLRDEAARCQTRPADPRVTRVGRFLRRTSLDELPQLLNVIRGEMSIVGPRPHALGMTVDGKVMHELTPDYIARHRVKPGMTGWAQICGCRGEVETLDKLRRRVAYDCYYIENWSLRLDLWIVLRTAAVLLFDKNAY